MSDDKIVGGCVILSVVLLIALIRGIKYFLSKNEERKEENKVASKTDTSAILVKRNKIRYIPEANIEEVYKLWDKKESDDSGVYDRYLFWKKIEELIPETKDDSVTWSFECEEDVMHPYMESSED
jgi:hypothetical protein